MSELSKQPPAEPNEMEELLRSRQLVPFKENVLKAHEHMLADSYVDWLTAIQNKNTEDRKTNPDLPALIVTGQDYRSLGPKMIELTGLKPQVVIDGISVKTPGRFFGFLTADETVIMPEKNPRSQSLTLDNSFFQLVRRADEQKTSNAQLVEDPKK